LHFKVTPKIFFFLWSLLWIQAVLILTQLIWIMEYIGLVTGHLFSIQFKLTLILRHQILSSIHPSYTQWPLTHFLFSSCSNVFKGPLFISFKKNQLFFDLYCCSLPNPFKSKQISCNSSEILFPCSLVLDHYGHVQIYP